MEASACSAIITAAGMSSRMGRLKPLLPLGDSTYIRHLISTFLRAGLEDIVVVGGRDFSALREHLTGIPVRLVYNEKYASSQMFDSVCLGLKARGKRDGGTFITPIDAPLFSEKTVLLLLRSSAEAAKPGRKGRTGHPLFLSSAQAERAEHYTGEEGLWGFLRTVPGGALAVETDDPFAFGDTDTPEEYAALIAKYDEYRKNCAPDAATLEELSAAMSDREREQGELLCRRALEHSARLRQRGIEMNDSVLASCALLYPRREEAAGKLKTLGFVPSAEALRGGSDGIFDEGELLRLLTDGTAAE